MTGMPIEATISNGIFSVLGDPNFVGVGIVGFFMAAVFLVPTHPALKVLAFFGGVILALPYLGWGLFLLSFGMGLILWFAVKRFWG
jgi:hypothetical protein